MGAEGQVRVGLAQSSFVGVAMFGIGELLSVIPAKSINWYHSYLHHQSHHHHDRHHHHPHHDQHQHQHLHHQHYYHYLRAPFAGGQSTSQSFIFKDLKCGTMWSGQLDNAINLFIRHRF